MAHDSSNTRMQPMRVKETLNTMATGFNYSFRKFMLRSDKGVDKLMPTDLSVANLMHEKIDIGEDTIEQSEIGNSMVSLMVSLNGQMQ